MSLFDGIQDNVFNIVNKTFGDYATWIPTISREKITGGILFKDATETYKILDQPYSPKNCIMEYKKGDFVGLFESVSRGSEEIVTIKNIEYGVMKVISKYDGKTFIAELQLL